MAPAENTCAGSELLACLLVGVGHGRVLSVVSAMVFGVTLREWRGVSPVAAPSGVAISTRLRTTAADERVLDLVAQHMGRLRRADLARVVRPALLDPTLDGEQRRSARRGRLNARKGGLTAQSSARWANAVIAGNDDQYRLAREARHRADHRLTVRRYAAAPTPKSVSGRPRRC
jgi:hypothetical protein